MISELQELKDRLMPEDRWEQQIGRLRRSQRVDALLAVPFDTVFTVSQTAAMLGITRSRVWEVFFSNDWDLEDRGAVLTDAEDAVLILGEERQKRECLFEELRCEVGGEQVSLLCPGGLFLSKSAVMLMALHLGLSGEAENPRLLLDRLLLQAGYHREDQLMLGIARAALEEDAGAMRRAMEAWYRFKGVRPESSATG